jgi:predicted nuclease of predicted toxin-antitoxin system
MIVIDENVEYYWAELLIKKGYKTYSIREKHQGISDLQIIEIVKNQQGILLTEDKDFGELVFAYGITNVTVVFLRYDQPQYHQIEKNLLLAIEEYYKKPGNYFITVTQQKIRLRKI